VAIVELADDYQRYQSVDVESYYVPSDGLNWANAFMRAQRAVFNAGIVRCQQRPTYLFTSSCYVTSSPIFVGAAGTTIQAVPGVTAFYAPPYGDQVHVSSAGGWGLENLIVQYTGSNTESGDVDGIFTGRVVTMDKVTIQGFPGQCLNVLASHALDPPGNANSCLFFRSNFLLAGKNGTLMRGSDANSYAFIMCNANGCGKRNVAYPVAVTSTVDVSAIGSVASTLNGKTVDLRVNSGPQFGTGAYTTCTFSSPADAGAVLSQLQAAFGGLPGLTIDFVSASDKRLVFTVTPPAAGPYARLDIRATSTATGILGFAAKTYAGDSDAWGFKAGQFLNGSYDHCGTVGNLSPYGGAIYAGEDVQNTTIYDFYAEGGQKVRITPPALCIGGALGNDMQVAPNMAVIPTIGGATGTAGSPGMSQFALNPNSANASQWLLGRQGTDQLWAWTGTPDSNGISFGYNPGGFPNLIGFVSANFGGAVCGAVTTKAHARGPGHTYDPRGTILGGYRFHSLPHASLPATNGNPAVTGSEVYAVGDIVFHNADLAAGTPGTPAWSYLASIGAGGALTWRVGASLP
jgi:hypothetical protein